MDFEKLLQLSQDQLSEYFETFVTTLRNPHLKFLPLVSSSREQKGVLATASHDEAQTSRINPKLFIFVLISIFLGLIIAAFVPGKKEAPDIVKAIMLVLTFWLAISYLLYPICKLLKGRETVTATVSMGLQILSVVFVVSSLLALIWGVLFKNERPYEINVSNSNLFGFDLTSSPLNIYFVVQLVLLSIYLQIGLGRLHGFRRWQRVIFLVILPITLTGITYFNAALYATTGVRYTKSAGPEIQSNFETPNEE